METRTLTSARCEEKSIRRQASDRTLSSGSWRPPGASGRRIEKSLAILPPRTALPSFPLGRVACSCRSIRWQAFVLSCRIGCAAFSAIQLGARLKTRPQLFQLERSASNWNRLLLLPTLPPSESGSKKLFESFPYGKSSLNDITRV